MSSFVLYPADGQAGDGFGWAVATSADGLTVVVGGYLDDRLGHTDQGSARVFVWDGSAWVQRGGSISPDGGRPYDYYGSSVGISADGFTVILGATGSDTTNITDRGAAMVFHWSGTQWLQLGGLTGPYGSANDNFGSSVALTPDGMTAVVGDAGDDISSATDRGSGWVFDWNGSAWVARPTFSRDGILDPAGKAYDYFGGASAISADGRTVVFGAVGDNSAQVFIWDGAAWTRRGQAIRPSEAGTALWGSSVDIAATGLSVVVGGVGDTINGHDAQGSVRVLDWDGTSWVQRGGVISPAAGAAADQFGYSVAMTPDGLTTIIGGIGDDVDGKEDQGSAYVFDWNGTGWTQRGTILTPSDGMAGDQFGSSVAISADGRIAIVGGGSDDVAYADQGSARVFEWNGSSWIEGLLPGLHAAVPNSLDGTPVAQTLVGTAGADILAGGAGNDVYVVNHLGDTITEFARNGTDLAFVEVDDWTVMPHVEQAHLRGSATRLNGGSGNDQLVANPLLASTLRGQDGDDILWGGSADGDVLDGGIGQDILRSGTGITRMIGGVGDDQFVVNNATDTVVEFWREGTDTAWVAVSGWTAGDYLEFVRLLPGVTSVALGAIGAEVVSASTGSVISALGGSNTFFGQGGADHFIGGSGTDLFRSGNGVTRMEGGAGNDRYVINNAASSAVELEDGGTDTAWVAVNGWTVGDHVEFAYLSGTATSITGNASGANLVANPLFGSTLMAGSGFTVAWGSDFADVIRMGVGGGNVYLKGGADRLVFGEHWGLVQVSDFSQSGGDELDFSASGLTKADLLIRNYEDKVLVEHAGEQIILYGVTTPLPDTAFLF